MGGVFGLEVYRVAFIGHREVDKQTQVADELDRVLPMLFGKHEYIEFYVGKNGEFALYGEDRMNYVLANTVQELDNDGRFSPDNKAWAECLTANIRISAITYRTNA